MVPFEQQDDDLKKKLAKNNEAKMYIRRKWKKDPIYRGKKERVKSIALKSKKESSDDETSTCGSDDEEYAMAVRNFKKFFRRKGKFVRQPREKKKSFRQRYEKKGKSDRKCFRCGDPNHLIGDCLKPSLNKDQTAFIGGSWSDSENDAEDKTNDETCLMDQSSNKVCLRTYLEPDEWIKDSGCSKHMIGNKSLFSTYKAYDEVHNVLESLQTFLLKKKKGKRYKADIRATNILLQELTKDDRESQLYDEFERFCQIKGETIHVYYVRFSKLINDMRNIKMTMSRMQLNSKFVNNMLPEWSRFITEVKLNRGLKESNFDQLYAYLKQHEVHANENRMMMERFIQPTNDPLALVSNASVQQYPTQSSESPQFSNQPSLKMVNVLDEEQLLLLAGEQVTNLMTLWIFGTQSGQVFKADHANAIRTRKKFTSGKLNCGYQWRPTAKKFALGELCPLTRLPVTCGQQSSFDAPSTSHSLSSLQVHPPVFPQGVAAGPTIEDTSITQADLHPSVNPVEGEPSSAQSPNIGDDN
ncbi:zf-CCHC domain-containing protein [Tanacetum coccineum]